MSFRYGVALLVHGGLDDAARIWRRCLEFDGTGEYDEDIFWLLNEDHPRTIGE